MGDVFLNEVFIGNCENAKDFVKRFRQSRRLGDIEDFYNVYYDEKQDFVYIEGTPGRVRRPLIIVDKGVSKLTPEVKEKLKTGEIGYNDLVTSGIIEYLDTLEADNALVALTEEDITSDHTHLEISPILIFGWTTGTVPFCDYDEPGRLMRGQKTVKQAVGMYALNFHKRKETDRNLLMNPQRPLVQTYVYDLLKFDNHPAGQNCTVAIMSYEGYNMEDRKSVV